MRNGEEFRIGADVIGYLLPQRHPMLMVDQIIGYRGSPAYQLSAERYVSANEPVFVGHFPDLKLWPGIYTIEGLRQCCVLFDILHQLDERGLLGGLQVLQRSKMLQPRVDKKLCQQVLDTLPEIRQLAQGPLRLRVKLIAPIFPGCILVYQVYRNTFDIHTWFVQAEVNSRCVAQGEIVYPSGVG
ncbi:MAG: hypothetical protein OXH00_04560 [Candidatus Poribacteria bacterium]|nr:hypothetical protein [Candidatus Poribacteria bacterium]